MSLKTMKYFDHGDLDSPTTTKAAATRWYALSDPQFRSRSFTCRVDTPVTLDPARAYSIRGYKYWVRKEDVRIVAGVYVARERTIMRPVTV